MSYQREVQELVNDVVNAARDAVKEIAYAVTCRGHETPAMKQLREAVKNLDDFYKPKRYVFTIPIAK